MKRHGGHRSICASTLQDLSVKARRTPGIPIRSLPCPDCSAAMGEYCFTASGKRLPNGHAARRRIVLRSLRDAGPESGKMSV